MGEKTEQRLLLHFGSVARIASASIEELSALVSRPVAELILNTLKGDTHESQ